MAPMDEGDKPPMDSNGGTAPIRIDPTINSGGGPIWGDNWNWSAE